MMHPENTSPLVQVFICTRTKEKGESCGPKGGAELRDRLKSWAKESGIHKEVKVTASLCLGHCENGITSVIHPANTWFIKIDKDLDFEKLKIEILEHLKREKSGEA